ncbi:MAG: hypothetical protein ACI3XL_01615 [Eubacteriales bacterium]
MEKVMNEIEKRKALLKSGFGIVSVLLVLILAIYAVSGDTFGWFAMNDTVGANNMGIVAEGNPISAEYSYKAVGATEYAPIDSWEKLFEGLTPGDSVTLRAVYTNTSDDDYVGELYLTAGADGEIPLGVDSDGDGNPDKYYYFGSQIIVESVNGTANGAFLVANSGNEVAKDALLDSIADTPLASGLIIPANDGTQDGQLVVEIVFTFVNMPVSQNAYKNFGSSSAGEKCSRMLVLIPQIAN